MVRVLPVAARLYDARGTGRADVAYVSLYRRYRPQSFADVVGQEHVTRTLVNAIAEQRLHHAYLFTGPRGTGKTSTARILAKAVNCAEGPTPEPCNACENCQAITDGGSIDVIELDMASHGGVDDARELRDRALFAPAGSRRKVYILDEVHMASTAAFNALLKLLEEPPAHVLFAMATTDPQKVIPTILSRVQRLDLRRVAAADLAAHVRRVCEAEGYAITDDALEAVVTAGDGSVRDALSVLEQVLAYAAGEVTADAVAQVLGRTPIQQVTETVGLVAQRDLAGLLGVVQGLVDGGHDLRRFTLDLVAHLRNLLVLQVAPDRPDLVDATDERRARLAEQAGLLPRDTLLRAVDLLAATVAEQRRGSPRLPLELVLAKLAVVGADGDLGELADRVARLEAEGAARGADTTPAVRSTAQPAEPEPAPTSAEEPVPVEAAEEPVEAAQEAVEATEEPLEAAEEAVEAGEEAVEAGGEASTEEAAEDELARLVRNWPGVLDLVKRRSRRCHAVFEPATPVAVERGIVTLRYPKRYASFHATNAGRGEYADVLRKAIRRACELELRIDVAIEGEEEPRRPQPPSVTPDDARTPVLDPQPRAAEPEEIDVREAELEGSDASAATPAPDELLANELGAELIDERPAPGS